MKFQHYFTRVILQSQFYPDIYLPASFEATMSEPTTYTAFGGETRIATGALPEVAVAIKRAARRGVAEPILIFDDTTGSETDFNLRGSEDEIRARHTPPPAADEAPAEKPRGRGRPKLGVVAREVTLLPRHWEWLNAQPGGASVALRKLVEAARHANAGKDRRRKAQEAAYRFLRTLAGDRPGYEEATRALFADDRAGFAMQMTRWPADIRAYALKLAFPNEEQAS